MEGDERVRRCAECNLDVYNLSEMTAEAAAEFLRARGGERTCVRMFQRADGTLLTRDCPVGIARIRRTLGRLWTAAVALAAFLGLASWFRIPLAGAQRNPGPVDRLAERCNPPLPDFLGQAVMPVLIGKIAPAPFTEGPESDLPIAPGLEPREVPSGL